MGNYFETFYPPFFMERRYAYNAIAVNPDGYDRADEAIIADLTKRLQDLAPLDTSGVLTESNHEVVTLSGVISCENAAQFLGRVADRILGVRAVRNNLKVLRAGATISRDQLRDDHRWSTYELDPKPVEEMRY
jgi:hypothetical protein